MVGDPLLEFLGEGHRLRFIPFGGSGGDRLLQFCERRLIEESASSLSDSEYEADCLCYHGGGMLGYYDDIGLLEGVGPGPEPLVFFPRACCWKSGEARLMYEREFRRIGRKLIVFSRDMVSHDRFAELQGTLEVDLRLSHDCAVLYSTVFDLDKPMLMTVLRDPNERLVAVYRRTDVESLEWPEFSLVGEETCLSLDPAMVGFLSPEHTFTQIGQAAYLAYWTLCYMPKVVVTDRLHVALARWMFSLPTIVLPGREHKIRAAWEHSLSDDPRGLVFVESVEELEWAVNSFGLELEVKGHA